MQKKALQIKFQENGAFAIVKMLLKSLYNSLNLDPDIG